MKFSLTFGLTALMALAIASAASADTRERAITISTDAFSGTFNIDIVRDSTGALKQMAYQTPNTPNGLVSPNQLAQGQTIYSKDDHDVIILRSESDFNLATGGHMVVRFLNDALSGTYKDFRVLVQVGNSVVLSSDPDVNDPDSDNNSYTGVFNHLFLQKNTDFGITVGIDQVVPSEE